MTKRKLAAELCKREGGKSQARIGDVMTLLTKLEDMIAEEYFAYGYKDLKYHFLDSLVVGILFENAQKKLDKMWAKEKKGKK